jgi:4-nitrophenyl phosphatase
LKEYRLAILDLDGTLYRGQDVLPGAVETVGELRRRGRLVRFLTNNSGETRSFYMDKLTRMGFQPKPEEIYSSAIGAAKTCVSDGFQKVFYVGEEGLEATLKEYGIEVVNSGGGQANAVVVGICRQFTYDWMNDAFQQIQEGAAFIATNTDATYPVEEGRIVPGAGAVVASIAAAAGVEPRVIGKPNPFLVQLILEEASVAPSDALCVGDRYETDILSGMNAGVDTHLVLTGVAKEAPPGVGWSKTISGIL